MSVEQDETSGFETSVNDYPVEAETEAQETNQEEPKIDDSKGVEEEAKNEDNQADNSGENATAEDDNANQEEAGEPKPKKQNRVQKRIDDVVREREEAKRRAEAAEKRLAELEDKKTEDKSDQAKEEPVESDYEAYDDYLKAVDDYDQQQEEEGKEEPKKSEESNGDELTDAQRTAMALIKEKVDQDADKYSDFAEVALNPEVPITGEMLEALAECDDPTKVMYHLGKNKDLASQIAEKSPAQQMREIAKLDLTAVVKPPKPTKTTQASDPISPVGGSSAQEKAIEDMSFSEYEAAMNAKEKSSSARW